MSMASYQRPGKRQVKLRRDPNFVYETNGADFLVRRGADQQPSSHSDSPAATSSNKVNSDLDSVTWSVIELPLFNHTDTNNYQILTSINNTYIQCKNLNIYQSTDSQGKEEESSDNFVNNSRRKSSTRGDFLDETPVGKINFVNSNNIFLSASSTVNSNTSDMGDSDSSVTGEKGVSDCSVAGEKGGKGSPVVASASPKINAEDINALVEAVGKINLSNTTVLRLENAILQQGQRLHMLEESARSSQESSNEKKKMCKSKKERVDEEKERQLKVLREKLE